MSSTSPRDELDLSDEEAQANLMRHGLVSQNHVENAGLPPPSPPSNVPVARPPPFDTAAKYSYRLHYQTPEGLAKLDPLHRLVFLGKYRNSPVARKLRSRIWPDFKHLFGTDANWLASKNVKVWGLNRRVIKCRLRYISDIPFRTETSYEREIVDITRTLHFTTKNGTAVFIKGTKGVLEVFRYSSPELLA
ncbi:hypothetical protein T439DRAFT_355921 [Meredithblackwellia eburnea MCA 4105]